MLRELIYVVKCVVKAILRHRTVTNVALNLLKSVLRYIVGYLIRSTLFNRALIVLYYWLYRNSYINYDPKVRI